MASGLFHLDPERFTHAGLPVNARFAEAVLLRRMPAVPAARFVLPGGPLIPCAALLAISWLMASSSWAETRDAAIWTALGAVVYAMGRWRGRRTALIP